MIQSNIIVVEATQQSASPAQTEAPAIANTELVSESVVANVADGVTVIDATVGDNFVEFTLIIKDFMLKESFKILESD